MMAQTTIFSSFPPGFAAQTSGACFFAPGGKMATAKPEPALAGSIERVCRHFSLGGPTEIATAGGTRNLSFVVETASGRWLVRRRYAGYADGSRVRFDHAALGFLASAGVPVVPPVLGPNGDTWWEENGEVWEVYAFVRGRHLLDGQKSDAMALASALSEFHRAGSTFELRYDKLGPRGETDPHVIASSIDKLLSTDPALSDVLGYYRAALDEAAAGLTDAAYSALPHTLIHGDIQPANVLMDAGQVAAFVDMDWCCWRPRLYDLSFALLFCCAAHASPIGAGDIWSLTQSPDLSPELAAEFLTEYESNHGALTAAERAALGPQLALTWCHTRIHGAAKVLAQDRRAFLNREPRVPHIPYL